MMPPHNAGRPSVLMDAALIGMLVDGVNIGLSSERLGTRLPDRASRFWPMGVSAGLGDAFGFTAFSRPMWPFAMLQHRRWARPTCSALRRDIP